MSVLGRCARHSLAAVARRAARLPVVVDRRWPPLRQLKALTLSYLRMDAVAIDGFTLHLDATDSLRLGMGDRHEPALVELLPELLAPGDIAVDGGAHIGYLSLLMARAVGPTGHVHAFEPDPTNFGLLARNVAANRAANVTLHRCALWSSPGRRTLYLNQDHHADHRLWDAGDGRPTTEVASCRLDQLPGIDARRLRLIKLDLQGAEHAALLGAEALLDHNPELVLVLELWPRGLAGCSASADDVVTLLEDHGFVLYRFSGQGACLEAVDTRRLLRAFDLSRTASRLRTALRSCDWVDLVAMRRERERR